MSRHTQVPKRLHSTHRGFSLQNWRGMPPVNLLSLTLICCPRPTLLSRSSFDMSTNSGNIYLASSCLTLLFNIGHFQLPSDHRIAPLVHFSFWYLGFNIEHSPTLLRAAWIKISWNGQFWWGNFPAVWIFRDLFCESWNVCNAATAAKRWTREIWHFYHSLTAAERTSYFKCCSTLMLWVRYNI